MSFTSIALFVITIAFALTCIYVSKLLLRISSLLKTVTSSVSTVEQQLDQTIVETEHLITELGITANDVGEKINATTGMFQTIDQLGETTFVAASSLKRQAKKFHHDPAMHGTTPFIRTIQFTEYVSILMNSWRRGKKAATENK